MIYVVQTGLLLFLDIRLEGVDIDAGSEVMGQSTEG